MKPIVSDKTVAYRGALVAIAVVFAATLGYLSLLSLGEVTSDRSEAIAFWFFMPSVLFVIACVVGGASLNTVLSDAHRTSSISRA